MMIARDLGMTLADFESKVTTTEFEMWVGLKLLEQEECPQCGVAVKDFMMVDYIEVKCPVCGLKYHRIKRRGED